MNLRELIKESNSESSSVLNFSWFLKKQGYSEATIISRVKLMKVLVKRGANFDDPESVKGVIAQQDWSGGRKQNAVYMYSCYLKMLGRSWSAPNYRRVDKIPFIPTEFEIDQLIAGVGFNVSFFLRFLKETGARCGEAFQLRWEDVDFERNTVSVVPEKSSKPRIFSLSSDLMNIFRDRMKSEGLVFGAGTKSLTHFRKTFERQKKVLASKLCNPRLNRISFHTFRHWKATMLYHQTRDVLYVMNFLGHKNIKNTLIYVQMEEALFKTQNNEFLCKVASTIDEARILIESGFELVCDIDGCKMFRRRK